MTQDPRCCYVYAYLRSRDSSTAPKYTPYYIGKGSGRRAFQKARHHRIPIPKDFSHIVFIQEGLTEQEAFELEKYCIALYGRVDIGTGILRNRTNGGEGSSGAKRSRETRQKLSEARRGKFKGENSSFWGKKHSEESKKKMSESKQGEKHPFFGKRQSQEVKDLISIANRKYRYELISPDGVVYTVEDARRFTKEHNLDWSHLWKVISGKRTHHKGWTGRIVEKLK